MVTLRVAGVNEVEKIYVAKFIADYFAIDEAALGDGLGLVG
jgi:hypothetical protein